ncbi:hypothetical protein PS914_03274 [Pseudomonas fluorescens]|uniref:hypothetical protein n=1 Tax=Pseudomonas fluorescens TaxID=294 RepID=UPI001242EFF6|nr:hypothetical protein [Pseudomonas fluorescens]VVP92584.1 hypothetical protein PS914_03274 [Pseudomonas fluorescens]
MKLKAITTACAMRKLARFISSKPAKKVAYVRKRSVMLGAPDLSELSDEVLLGYLEANESLMGRFVEQYETKKHTITPRLVLNKKLLALTNEFVNVAVMAGVESILLALESRDNVRPAHSQAIITAMDSLFDDRDHLQEKLQSLSSLIKNPELVSEIIYTDVNTYNNVYHPVTGSDSQVDSLELEGLYGTAFLEFMGVDLCMLIHERCLEANKVYIPKVSGFNYEFYLYVVLHELVHLLLDADDNSYVYSDKDKVQDYNVYSVANLKAHEINNADNYVTLIFVALAELHKEGRMDLCRF